MTTEKETTLPDLFTLADRIATRYYSLKAQKEQRMLWGDEGEAQFKKDRDDILAALHDYAMSDFTLEMLQKCSFPAGVMERVKEKAVDELATNAIKLIKTLPPDYEGYI